MKTKLVLIAVGLMALATLLSLPGCGRNGAEVRAQWETGLAQTEDAIDDLNAYAGVADETIDATREQMRILADGGVAPEAMDDFQATLDKWLAVKQAATERLEQFSTQADEFRAKLAAIPDDSGGLAANLIAIGGAATSAAPLAPGPIGLVLAGIGTILGSAGLAIARGAKRREADAANSAGVTALAVTEVVRLLDAAKSESTKTVDFGDPATKRLLKAGMSPSTYQIVEAIRGGAVVNGA